MVVKKKKKPIKTVAYVAYDKTKPNKYRVKLSNKGRLPKKLRAYKTEKRAREEIRYLKEQAKIRGHALDIIEDKKIRKEVHDYGY